jgi:hypothetical protein
VVEHSPSIHKALAYIASSAKKNVDVVKVNIPAYILVSGRRHSVIHYEVSQYLAFLLVALYQITFLPFLMF